MYIYVLVCARRSFHLSFYESEHIGLQKLARKQWIRSLSYGRIACSVSISVCHVYASKREL